MLSLFLTLALQTAPATVAPATAELEDLHDVAAHCLGAGGLPGAWIGRVDLNGLTAAGVAGVRHATTVEPAELGDRLHLGSCTKAMTAALMAILDQQEVVDIGGGVAGYLRPLVPNVDPGWEKVTLEHLMVHQGGCPPNLDRFGLLPLQLRMHKGSAWEGMQLFARGVIKKAPAMHFNQKHVYSNAGYTVLGVVLGQTAGRPYRQLLREELFAPLGIENFGFGPPDAMPSQPTGHNQKGNPQAVSDNPPAYDAAGRVHMPLSEWAKFIAWHLRGFQGDTAILAKDNFRPLHVPRLDATYAGGLDVTERSWSKGPILTHAGSNTMWMCVVWMAPTEGVAYIAATNMGGDLASRALDSGVSMLIQRDRDAGLLPK